MKKIFLILILFSLFIVPGISYGQGTNCAGADPICLDVTNSYPAGVNSGDGEVGPNYSCLGSEPNPAWYYLRIIDSGDIGLHFVGGSSSNDIDFICWGPYSDITSVCGNLNDSGAPGTSHHASGAGGGYPIGNVIDCSYDASPEEWCYIPNGVTGEYYMLMVTNFSNTACSIIITQTDGSGTADCSFIGPPTHVINDSTLTVCSDSTLIEADNVFTEYLWSTGDTTPVITVYNSGNYYITATYADTLLIYDTIDVHLTQPYLSLNLGSDTLICSSASLILNAGSGFSNYDWNTGSSDSAITVSQTGIYQVLTTDTALCTYVDNINVVIDPQNSLELGNDTAICEYSPFILDAGIGFDDFIWSTGETTQSIQINSSGTYYVTATNNSCSVTVIDSLHATYIAVPIADAGINDTICQGQSGTLTANGGISYHWSTGSNNQTIVATPYYTTIYYVTVTNSNGCSAGDSAMIFVNPHVTANIMHENPHCGLNNGTATITTLGGTGPFTFQWSTTPQQDSSTAINLAAGTYYITTTDHSSGCTFVNNVVLSTVAMPSVSMQNISNVYCGMENGSATAYVNGGNSPFTYIWNSNPTQTSQTLSNVPSGNYCVTVSDEDACTGTGCVTLITTAYPAPEICMVTVDTSTNYNEIVWEKIVTNGIEQYYIYRESSVGGIYNLIGVQNYSDISTFIDSTSNSLQQSYRYKLAINDTCGVLSQQSSYHQTIHLAVNSGISGQWNLIWNNYEGFSFSTYNIYRGTDPGNMTLLNSVANSVTSYTDLAPPAGIVYYMIEVVIATPCNPSFKSGESISSTISNIANTDEVGIPEIFGNENIQIYPNPSSGIFTIKFSDPINSPALIEITNSIGQLVYSGNININTKSIDLSELSKGMYLLKLTVAEKSYFEKITIE
jgi:hypothetical protein